MNKAFAILSTLLIGVAAEAALVRLVPEDGTSKKFTFKTDSDVEYVIRFYRPDVFRVEAAPKVWTGEGTNRTYTVDYTDKRNDPNRKAQILTDGYAEDKTGVRFADKDGKFTFTTSSIVVSFDKETEKMSVADFCGKPVFSEADPLKFEGGTCTQTLASSDTVRYYGGGQQVGRLMHKGKKILIDCDYNWADGGCPNPAPFVVSSEGFGMLRHTFAPGSYDFTATSVSALTHDENRFDAFYFVSGGFPEVIDRYTEATGRPNLLPMWGLELGDADAYMTREKGTKYPKQEADGSFTETTPDVIRKVAMPYRDADMPVGWILLNDGYGCGHMMLASVVDALEQLNIKAGLWTEGKLDRIAWEVGSAGTRVQKLDVAWTSQGGTREMFQVYEDDGETLQYQKGAFTRQNVFVDNVATTFDEQGDLTVTTMPAIGDFDGKCATRVYEYLIHTQAKPASVFVKETDGVPSRPLVDRHEVLPLASTNGVEKLYANVRQGWYYDAAEKGGTLHVKLAKRTTSKTVVLEVRMDKAVVARDESPAYPVPSAEEDEAASEALVCKAVRMPIVNNTNVNKFADGDDMVVGVGKRIIVDRLDGTYRRILGHVATHPDNRPEARFTFTSKAGNTTLFERANMKGSDVPQLIAVDIPCGCDWVVFDFKADDESEASKAAKGVWKNVEFSAE